jgi:hypothetical protein
VTDRVAGEASERCDAIRNFFPANRAQREPIIKGQRGVAGHDRKRRHRHVTFSDVAQRLIELVEIDAAKLAVKHHPGDGDDRRAEKKADPIPADLLLQEPCDGPHRLQHRRLREDGAGSATTGMPEPVAELCYTGETRGAGY